MRYRQLPIEQRLLEVQRTQGDEAMAAARDQLFLAAATSDGFQFITIILRERERILLEALNHTHDPIVISALAGGRREIEQIRASLSALIPAEKRSAIDWFDDGEEDYVSPLERDGRRP